MESNTGVTPDLLVGLTPPDIQLDVPDMDRKRQERRTRTQSAMKTHNPTLARRILPECDNRSVEDIAATRIQATYRGHLGRKKYIQELYKLYEKEEAMRLEKTVEQVEEGQLLVENHQLEVQLDDDTTTWRNKSRQYLSKVITIQRAWRRYKGNRGQVAAQETDVDNDANMSPVLSETDEPTDASESSNGQQAMSVSSPEEADTSLLKDCCESDGKDWTRDDGSSPLHGSMAGFVPFIEAEPDSSVSDYSEMAEPIKEHLANVQIIQKEDLEVGNTIYPSQVVTNQKIPREPNETDEEFTKRVRKINYLSLAQEFAALKKIDAAALPFDMHKVQVKDLGSPMSDSSATETDSSERCYSESAGPSNAATPIEGHGDLLPNDNSAEQERSTNRTSANTDISNLSEQFYGAKVTSNQTVPTASCADGNQSCGDEEDGNILDNEMSRRLTDVSLRSGDNDTFHEQNVGDKKVNATYTQADFDVYNIESTLPQMDWDLLEEQLHRAAEEERQKKESRRNDREEIRRRLAMAGADEDYYAGERILKRPNLQTRLQSGMNLQICFMNEASADGDPNRGGGGAGGNGSANNPAGVQAPGRTAAPGDKEAYAVQPPGGRTSNPARGIKQSSKTTGKDDEEDEETEDFFTRQARLQAEARMALAQVRPMARMQLEVEKQMRKKSPIAEIVGIPGFGDGKRRKLALHLLQQMNLAQLQVVVNDLHGQIASLNEELVKLLVERDDLHMAQDSMLVDIEDLTRYCAAKSAAVGHRNVLASK